MTNKERVTTFSELYDLLTFFYENRDQPVDSDFDFYQEVEKLCIKLEMDFEFFKETFKL